MSLDKEEKPLGLKFIQFITTNVFWYLIFSLIYLSWNPKEWWLIENIWGRVIIVFLELTFFYSSFKEKNYEKD